MWVWSRGYEPWSNGAVWVLRVAPGARATQSLNGDGAPTTSQV